MRRNEMYKPILLISALVITFITGFVGITLSNTGVQPVGFILMGVGLGGFFLIIVGAILITTLLQRRAEKKQTAPRLTYNGGFGKVTDVRIDPDSDDESPSYVISVSVDKHTPVLTLKSQKRHHIGDTVEFRGNPRIPKTLELCPEYYYEDDSEDSEDYN